jgi:hypothetical protein
LSILILPLVVMDIREGGENPDARLIETCGAGATP